ncbi:MAG: hypothetical protein NVSMB47_16280 [Polyangiales bacterium]
MATSKRTTGGRPKLGSSHAGVGKRRPTASGGAFAAKPAKKGAKKKPPIGKAGKAGKPTKPAKKPAGIASSARRPRHATIDSLAPNRAREPKGKRPEIRSEPSEEARTLALAIAMAALDKKAVNVQILDVVGRIDYADYLVLMSGRSDRHVVSIADGIEESLGIGGDGAQGRLSFPRRRATAVEGRAGGNWVVLDFADVVAHVFQEEARSFYDLDSLWEDARRIPVAGSERD